MSKVTIASTFRRAANGTSFAFGLALSLLVSMPGLAQPPSCTVIVGPTPDPELTEANLQWTLHVVRQIRQTGEQCQVHLIDAWARANKMFADGDADVLFPEIVGDPTQPGITGRPVALTYGFTVFTLTEHPQINTLNELAGQTVGLIRGRYYPDALLSHPDITISYVNSLEQNFRLLDHKRIDATIEYLSDGLNLLEQMDMANPVHHGAEFDVKQLAYRFQDTSAGQELRRRFDRAIQVLKANGTYTSTFTGTTQRLIP